MNTLVLRRFKGALTLTLPNEFVAQNRLTVGSVVECSMVDPDTLIGGRFAKADSGTAAR